MKNFKKVLALVLVLATLMGLATVAGAAYTDADKIDADYSEAVKVLELIETMEGYPDGSFGPKKTITREEAAKLIAIFDNKDSDISTYYTSINPFADEKGRWGESYVGYCFRAGIVGGRNANTFDPTANVTGTEFLKMALVTLGYDAEEEGFVGASWAVNVLSLARRLGLVDGLADGWKAEADLTREEAAQILLNTLNTDTVEYGSAVKAFLNKDSFDAELGADGYVRFNGKLYATVAGAVSTGSKLYKEFNLSVTESSDAFMRPTTKWTLDDESVSQMKAPKATFTTSFDGCDLLVALGVKTTDLDTEIVIGEVYRNGGLLSNEEVVLKHTPSDCKACGKFAAGAQGTLTQVFKMKDAEGETYYRVCMIDTWLGKVTKVTNKTTARDDHYKTDDAVELDVYVHEEDHAYGWNNEEYCTAAWTGCYQNGTNWNVYDGVAALSFDDPEGLTKGDYVLVTYSWKTGENCVETVEVTKGVTGRLNGYKAGSVTNDPTYTRVDGEFIADAVHFHLGYMDSKDVDNYGAHVFFYDAYGNVIGMKDTADSSVWGVLDGAYVTYTKGEAALNVEVVDLDAKISEGIAKQLKDEDGYDDLDVADVVADIMFNTEEKKIKDPESKKAFSEYYDHLYKISTDANGKYTIVEEKVETEDDGVTVVNGKPYINVDGTKVTTTSATQYLIHKNDGTYVAYTGYKNVPSLTANYVEYVMDDDQKCAEVVYITDEVYFTDGKFTAYVGKPADLYNIETSDDGDTYYVLTAWVEGVAKEVYVDQDQMNVYFDEAGDKDNKFEAGFYKFQYVDIDDVTVVKVVETGSDIDLNDEYTVEYFNGTVLEVNGEEAWALADDCALYGIYKGKIVEIDADEIEENDTVHVTLDDDDNVTAIYLVLANND